MFYDSIVGDKINSDTLPFCDYAPEQQLERWKTISQGHL